MIGLLSALTHTLRIRSVTALAHTHTLRICRDTLNGTHASFSCHSVPQGRSHHNSTHGDTSSVCNVNCEVILTYLPELLVPAEYGPANKWTAIFDACLPLLIGCACMCVCVC
eukprot:scpid65126/ scgid20494/ 